MLSIINAEKSKLIAALNGAVIGRGSNKDILDKLHEKLISYVRSKDSSVPRTIYELPQFENESGTVSFLKYDGGKNFINILRFSEPDDMVAGRSWVVELTSGGLDSHVMFGCRLYCYARNYDFVFEHSVPRVVKDVVDTVGLSDYGEVLLSSQSFIDDDAEVSDFIDLLRACGRI